MAQYTSLLMFICLIFHDGIITKSAVILNSPMDGPWAWSGWQLGTGATVTGNIEAPATTTTNCPNGVYCWELSENYFIYNYFSTMFFHNISLSIRVSGVNLEQRYGAGDSCSIHYTDQTTSNWSVIARYTGADVFPLTANITLPLEAAHSYDVNVGIKLQSQHLSGDKNDFCYFSDLIVSGTPFPSSWHTSSVTMPHTDSSQSVGYYNGCITILGGLSYKRSIIEYNIQNNVITQINRTLGADVWGYSQPYTQINNTVLLLSPDPTPPTVINAYDLVNKQFIPKWRDITVPLHVYYDGCLTHSDEYIFVVSGVSPNAQRLQIYDIFTNQWAMGPNLTVSRSYFSCVVSSFSNRLYAIAGMDTNGYHDTVEYISIINTTRDIWRYTADTLVIYIPSSVPVAYDKYIYILCGAYDSMYNMVNVQILNTETNAIILSDQTLSYDTNKAAVIIVNHTLYAFANADKFQYWDLYESDVPFIDQTTSPTLPTIHPTFVPVTAAPTDAHITTAAADVISTYISISSDVPTASTVAPSGMQISTTAATTAALTASTTTGIVTTTTDIQLSTTTSTPTTFISTKTSSFDSFTSVNTVSLSTIDYQLPNSKDTQYLYIVSSILVLIIMIVAVWWYVRRLQKQKKLIIKNLGDAVANESDPPNKMNVLNQEPELQIIRKKKSGDSDSEDLYIPQNHKETKATMKGTLTVDDLMADGETKKVSDSVANEGTVLSGEGHREEGEQKQSDDIEEQTYADKGTTKNDDAVDDV